MAASNHDIGFLGKSFHNRQKETGFQGLAMWRVVPFIPVFFVHKKKSSYSRFHASISGAVCPGYRKTLNRSDGIIPSAYARWLGRIR